MVTDEVKIETKAIYHFIESIDRIQDTEANMLIGKPLLFHLMMRIV